MRVPVRGIIVSPRAFSVALTTLTSDELEATK
jgi:hypothetical protein